MGLFKTPDAAKSEKRLLIKRIRQREGGGGRREQQADGLIQARNPINQASWIPLPPPASAPSELKAPEIFITPPPRGRGEECVALGVSIPSCSPPTRPVCVHIHMCACAHVCTPACAHLTGPGAICLLGTSKHEQLGSLDSQPHGGPRVWLKGWACSIGRLQGQVGGSSCPAPQKKIAVGTG